MICAIQRAVFQRNIDSAPRGSLQHCADVLYGSDWVIRFVTVKVVGSSSATIRPRGECQFGNTHRWVRNVIKRHSTAESSHCIAAGLIVPGCDSKFRHPARPMEPKPGNKSYTDLGNPTLWTDDQGNQGQAALQLAVLKNNAFTLCTAHCH